MNTLASIPNLPPKGIYRHGSEDELPIDVHRKFTGLLSVAFDGRSTRSAGNKVISIGNDEETSGWYKISSDAFPDGSPEDVENFMFSVHVDHINGGKIMRTADFEKLIEEQTEVAFESIEAIASEVAEASIDKAEEAAETEETGENPQIVELRKEIEELTEGNRQLEKLYDNAGAKLSEKNQEIDDLKHKLKTVEMERDEARDALNQIPENTLVGEQMATADAVTEIERLQRQILKDGPILQNIAMFTNHDIDHFTIKVGDDVICATRE